jgi:predicted transcriptional regulator
MKSFLQGTGKAEISLPSVVMMRRAATSDMAFMGKDNEDDILKLVTEIVAAYVSKNPVAASELPAIIKNVHATLGGFAGGQQSPLPKAPAVPVKKSVQPDFIVCLEDGKKLTMLKRYLRSRYKMSPGEYRTRWNLPADYPMVAPNYAKKRSDFAKKIGLGKGEGRKGKRKKS